MSRSSLASTRAKLRCLVSKLGGVRENSEGGEAYQRAVSNRGEAALGGERYNANIL